MHAEASYWALLTEASATMNIPDPSGMWLTELLNGWLQAGNRSVRELFELHPDVLAAALGRPVDELAPLLALRTRLSRAERVLIGLARAGVDLLTQWDRRYPRTLRGMQDEDAPPVLWFAGSLDLLARQPISVLGTRDITPEASAFARTLAAELAIQGRPVLGGVSRPIERATLEAALAEADGGYIAVLGQGIARALPDLQRLQGQIRAGRLLLLSPWHPETFWQPRMESLRSTLVVALSARVVLAQVAAADSTWEVAQRTLQAQRPLLVRATDDEGVQALLAQGALSLEWPAASTEALVIQALTMSSKRERSVRESSSDAVTGVEVSDQSNENRRRMHAGKRIRTERKKEAATDPSPRKEPLATAVEIPSMAVDDLAEMVVRLLQRRRGVTGKGSLLQALPVTEVALDRVLAMLIAGGRVMQRPHRTGAGYVALKDGTPDAREGGFQLSLFGQQDE